MCIEYQVVRSGFAFAHSKLTPRMGPPSHVVARFMQTSYLHVAFCRDAMCGKLCGYVENPTSQQGRIGRIYPPQTLPIMADKKSSNKGILMNRLIILRDELNAAQKRKDIVTSMQVQYLNDSISFLFENL